MHRHILVFYINKINKPDDSPAIQANWTNYNTYKKCTWPVWCLLYTRLIYNISRFVVWRSWTDIFKKKTRHNWTLLYFAMRFQCLHIHKLISPKLSSSSGQNKHRCLWRRWPRSNNSGTPPTVSTENNRCIVTLRKYKPLIS